MKESKWSDQGRRDKNERIKMKGWRKKAKSERIKMKGWRKKG